MRNISKIIFVTALTFIGYKALQKYTSINGNEAKREDSISKQKRESDEISLDEPITPSVMQEREYTYLWEDDECSEDCTICAKNHVCPCCYCPHKSDENLMACALCREPAIVAAVKRIAEEARINNN